MHRDAITTRPILLAPARTLAGVRTALSAGADAVYAGLAGRGRGGARAGLAREEIPRAVAFCRAAGAELHAALNAIPATRDIPSFLEDVARLARDGVGTVILNDPGLIVHVRRGFPGLRITASVGLSTLNAPGAVFYRELGADAVVLPTTMGRDEVPAIRGTGLSVEVFVRCRAEILVHGTCALPGYAIEGSALAACAASPGGSRSSAKRGGPCGLVCRTLPVGLEAHSIEDELRSWIRAGVAAFKIEGRETPGEHLREIVARIRRKLDDAIASEAAGA